MQEYLKFYIDGEWVDPISPSTLEVINPANEQPFAVISMGGDGDVEKAVSAAKVAFESYFLSKLHKFSMDNEEL